MTEQANHAHVHGAGCGHSAVQHAGHVGYLHDGHLHHQEGGVVTEHVLEVSEEMPANCTPDHRCGGHGAS